MAEIVVIPEVHVSAGQQTRESLYGEPIEKLSFRHEARSSLMPFKVTSGLFPFHLMFPTEIIQPPNPLLELGEVIYQLENGRLNLRWPPLSAFIKTAQMYWVSNKRPGVQAEWVSFQNSFAIPYKIVEGERIDFFFKVFDQNNSPVFLKENALSLYVGKVDAEKDLQGFWQFNTTPEEQTIPETVITEKVSLDFQASMEAGVTRVLWRPLTFQNFSISKYVLKIERNGVLTNSIDIEEPDSVYYIIPQEVLTAPYDVRMTMELHLRKYLDNSIVLYYPKDSQVTVHAEQADTITSDSLSSVYTETSQEFLSTVHPTLREGDSNIIREFNSTLYHVAKGIELIKKKNSLVEELSSLELRTYSLLSELGNPHLIKAFFAMKGQPQYVEAVTRPLGLDFTVVTNSPYDLLLNYTPEDLDPFELADLLLDSLPVNVSPIIIRNDDMPCVFTFDQKVNPPNNSLGLWSECSGYKYGDRVIIYLINKFIQYMEANPYVVGMTQDVLNMFWTKIPFGPLWSFAKYSEIGWAGQAWMDYSKVHTLAHEYEAPVVTVRPYPTYEFQIDPSWHGTLSGYELNKVPGGALVKRHGFIGMIYPEIPGTTRFSSGLSFSKKTHEAQLMMREVIRLIGQASIHNLAPTLLGYQAVHFENRYTPIDLSHVRWTIGREAWHTFLSSQSKSWDDPVEEDTGNSGHWQTGGPGSGTWASPIGPNSWVETPEGGWNEETWITPFVRIYTHFAQASKLNLWVEYTNRVQSEINRTREQVVGKIDLTLTPETDIGSSSQNTYYATMPARPWRGDWDGEAWRDGIFKISAELKATSETA